MKSQVNNKVSVYMRRKLIFKNISIDTCKDTFLNRFQIKKQVSVNCGKFIEH